MKFIIKKNPKNFIEANAVLNKIGNQKPYFSLTGRIVENGRVATCGACHDEILEAFPELDDLVAIHLSDIDGKPMHSLEDGKYWAGFTKWQNGNIKYLSELLRISEKSAQRLSYDSLVEEARNIKEDTGKDVLPEELFKDFHDRQLRRWKQEADNIIKKYSLEIVADKKK
jgi:hypothetical protein